MSSAFDIERYLLDLYFERDWKRPACKPPTGTEHYTDSRDTLDDRNNNTHREFRLNERGIIAAEFILRKYGAKVKPEKYVVMEMKMWRNPVVLRKKSDGRRKELVALLTRAHARFELHEDVCRVLDPEDISYYLSVDGKDDTSWWAEYFREEMRFLRDNPIAVDIRFAMDSDDW